MIVHIVMIKLKDRYRDEDNLQSLKRKIESLIDVIPSLKSIDVGINFANEDRAMDMVLSATFDDRDGLKEYAINPKHQEIIHIIKRMSDYTKVVDYEDI